MRIPSLLQSSHTLLLVALTTSLLIPRGHAATPEQQRHEAGDIRVFYYTEGPHAVDATDRNNNRVPDQVEDLLTQTRVARALWVEVLGYPDPLKSERFKVAKFLDIHIRSRELLKSNGLAFDELQYYKRKFDPPGTASICFNVASSVKPDSNLTPAHEFFHLIQYCSNYFKNRWYTEGLARWSEGALGLERESAGSRGTVWPVAEERKAMLTSMTYDAADKFWIPLITAYDSSAELPDTPLTRELSAMTYVSGTKVIRDTRLRGWKFVRDLLGEMGRVDDKAFQEAGYDRWSEANQNSAENHRFILEAIDAVVRRSSPAGATR